jgi:mannose-1-phosphate guanylyltransferase/phosphomannomutase
MGSWSEKRIILQFFDSQGLPIDKGMERKIENAFLQEDFARPDTKGLGLLEKTSHMEEPYLWEILSRVNVDAIHNRRLKVVFHCESPQVMSVMHQILERLGCRVITVFNGDAVLKEIVRDNRADIGIQLDISARTFRVWTDQGYLLSEAEVLFLQTMISLNHQAPIAIPVSAPSTIEELAEQAGVPYVRTKTVSRSLLEPGKMNPLQVHFDGFYSLTLILDYLTREELTSHQLIDDIPDFHMTSDWVECPIELKGRVMRRLMEDVKGQRLELIDGIKVFNDDGWALILPDSERALFKVVVQGHSPDQAQALADMYKSKIASFKQG